MITLLPRSLGRYSHINNTIRTMPQLVFPTHSGDSKVQEVDIKPTIAPTKEASIEKQEETLKEAHI